MSHEQQAILEVLDLPEVKAIVRVDRMASAVAALGNLGGQLQELKAENGKLKAETARLKAEIGKA